MCRQYSCHEALLETDGIKKVAFALATRVHLHEDVINLVAVGFVMKYGHLGTNVAALVLALHEHVGGTADIAVVDMCRKGKCWIGSSERNVRK